jgi:uncharacterized protein (DUF433 family)
MLHLITINSDICHGKPTIRGSRLLVSTILELLASGMSHQELMADYANLTENDIMACLEYAAQLARFRSELIAA